MIIYLQTNTPELANDIADEIRLFFEQAEVVLSKSENDDYSITTIFTQSDSEMITAVALNGKHTYSYVANTVTGDELIIKRYKKRCVKIAVFRALRLTYPDTFVPWGSLTGIRPTHLLRTLEAEEGSEAAAKQIMLEGFDVQEDKYTLAKHINTVQEPIIASVCDNAVDVYVGVPYCKTRCLYCSFAAEVRTNKTDMQSYIDALKNDITYGAQIVKKYGYAVRNMYFGGGTPTVLTESELNEVLSHLLNCYGTFGNEFTVEAGRPDTITKDKLRILRDFGISRVSVNPQTMNKKTLELIGRSHTPEDIFKAYDMAKSLDFIVNMDIITCLPGEGSEELAHTLSEIEQISPDNLTVHTLAIKRSSRLKSVLDEYISMMPKPVEANDMVRMGLACAKRLGMQPYYMYRQKYMSGNLENVGYAKPNYECAYNIDMMEETVSIMAHGAGAMSKRIHNGSSLRVERVPNPKDVCTYINKLDILKKDKDELFLR